MPRGQVWQWSRTRLNQGWVCPACSVYCCPFLTLLPTDAVIFCQNVTAGLCITIPCNCSPHPPAIPCSPPSHPLAPAEAHCRAITSGGCEGTLLPSCPSSCHYFDHSTSRFIAAGTASAPALPPKAGRGGPEGRPPPTITAEVTQPCIFGAFGAGWRRMSHGRRRQRLSWQQSPDGSAVLKVRGLPQQSLPPTALAALGKCRTWQLS